MKMDKAKLNKLVRYSITAWIGLWTILTLSFTLVCAEGGGYPYGNYRSRLSENGFQQLDLMSEFDLFVTPAGLLIAVFIMFGMIGMGFGMILFSGWMMLTDKDKRKLATGLNTVCLCCAFFYMIKGIIESANVYTELGRRAYGAYYVTTYAYFPFIIIALSYAAYFVCAKKVGDGGLAYAQMALEEKQKKQLGVHYGGLYAQNQEEVEKFKVDWNKMEMYLMINRKYFPAEKMGYLRDKLINMDERKEGMLFAIDLKDPSTSLIASLSAGSFGIDRFMLGEIGMGVLKALTFGCCGVLTIIDWFTIRRRAKEYNFNAVMTLV